MSVATIALGDSDIERARGDTPGASRVSHLNNAGAALPPTQVTESMIKHLRLEAELGGYEAAAAASAQVEGTYAAIARLIGCRADEVAVVENAPPVGIWNSTECVSNPETVFWPAAPPNMQAMSLRFCRSLRRRVLSWSSSTTTARPAVGS